MVATFPFAIPFSEAEKQQKNAEINEFIRPAVSFALRATAKRHTAARPRADQVLRLSSAHPCRTR